MKLNDVYSRPLSEVIEQMEMVSWMSMPIVVEKYSVSN